MFEKIKTHVKEHKEAYIVGGISIVACVGVWIVARKTVEAPRVSNQATQIGVVNRSTQVVIEMVERSTPSKPVHLVGTDLYFPSLSEASRKTGHSLPMLSKHINGHIPDLNGDVFELLTPA